MSFSKSGLFCFVLLLSPASNFLLLGYLVYSLRIPPCACCTGLFFGSLVFAVGIYFEVISWFIALTSILSSCPAISSQACYRQQSPHYQF